MGLLAWIILGAVAGWLASIAMGTNRSQGCAMDTIVGIVGAVLGGLLFRFFGGAGITGLNLWSLFTAFIGAVLLLAIVRAFRRPAPRMR
jgi:uncharacterized membrane protein YeaQ/YmgE (transglycosylase-associated protein family)